MPSPEQKVRLQDDAEITSYKCTGCDKEFADHLSLYKHTFTIHRYNRELCKKVLSEYNANKLNQDGEKITDAQQKIIEVQKQIIASLKDTIAYDDNMLEQNKKKERWYKYGMYAIGSVAISLFGYIIFKKIR
jgi:hypothetical protein